MMSHTAGVASKRCDNQNEACKLHGSNPQHWQKGMIPDDVHFKIETRVETAAYENKGFFNSTHQISKEDKFP